MLIAWRRSEHRGAGNGRAANARPASLLINDWIDTGLCCPAHAPFCSTYELTFDPRTNLRPGSHPCQGVRMAIRRSS